MEMDQQDHCVKSVKASQLLTTTVVEIKFIIGKNVMHVLGDLQHQLLQLLRGNDLVTQRKSLAKCVDSVQGTRINLMFTMLMET